MSEKVEHTPLPWSVSSLVPADGLYVLDGNYDFVAATAEWADDGTLIQAFGGIEKAIKNSEYIVLACNSYPALLAERDRLRKALGNLWDAAKEVHELGASSGGQWAALSLALEQSSPLLKDTNQ